MNHPLAPESTPTPARNRIDSVDVLRGVALLGILLLNIRSFAMPMAAYMNPFAYGDLSGINGVVENVITFAGMNKFMAIFSILFGASLLLQTSRTELLGEAKRIHYRRMVVLLVIGLLHAHLFWIGDILFGYAVAGMIVFLLRRHEARTLLIAGTISYLACVTIYVGLGAMMIVVARAFDPTVLHDTVPPPEMIEKELAIYRGPWLEQFVDRSVNGLIMRTFGLPFFLLGNGGLMLIGMALYKWRFFDASQTVSRYALIALATMLPGFAMIGLQFYGQSATNASPESRALIWGNINLLVSPLVATGYAAVVMIVCKLVPAVLLLPLRAVGRTALSCYLAQTVICTTIFYGHGFGLFGKLDRVEQLGVVVAVWAALLIVAPLWLAVFRFGPMEWLWRSLTYGRPQPVFRSGGQSS